MSNQYDTSGEPLGSTAVKVVYNNASNLDGAVNSRVSETWIDRPPFYRARPTLWGMEQAFNRFIAQSGFELPPLVYTDGAPLVVTRASQLVQRGGNLYSVKLPANFPLTLSGTWAADQNVLVYRSDNSLRQDLATPGGAGMVGLPQGGTVAQGVTHVTPAMFGAANNGAIDDFTAITQAVGYAASNNVELWLSGSYAISAGVEFSGVRKIRCFDDARIVPLFDSGVAVRWVAASGLLIEKPVQDGNLSVEWPTRDWTKDRTSFLLQNIYSGRFDFSSAKATRAVLLKGLEKGCTYNDIRFGVMSNNLVGVWLSSGSASGWCNANNFIGGRWYGMGGTGVGNTVAGSLYESRAGHIYVETTPYANNGNKFTNPSLEWIGPGFRLARMGGLSNTLTPIYCELRDGDATWIVDTGTNNNFELMGVPSISGGYDPDLAPAANRVDVSGATEPKVSGANGYIDGNVRQVVRTRNGARPAITAINTGVGAALEGRNTSSASNPSIVAAGPSGSSGVSIPAAGIWTMFGGASQIHWSMALIPTAGAWRRGDKVFFTNPSAGGYIGAVCVADGTPGTWKNFGAIQA